MKEFEDINISLWKNLRTSLYMWQFKDNSTSMCDNFNKNKEI